MYGLSGIRMSCDEGDYQWEHKTMGDSVILDLLYDTSQSAWWAKVSSQLVGTRDSSACADWLWWLLVAKLVHRLVEPLHSVYNFRTQCFPYPNRWSNCSNSSALGAYENLWPKIQKKKVTSLSLAISVPGRFSCKPKKAASVTASQHSRPYDHGIPQP